jgi:cytochrome c556
MPKAFLTTMCLLSLTALVAASCSTQPAAPAAPPAPYAPTASMKEIMVHIVDPAADAVWLAVMTVDTAQGTVETVPRSDEDWMKARGGAITLIEAANLLMTPGRHVGKPGDKSEVPGVELEPAEMEANIAKDLPEFHKAALRLHDAATQALTAIDAKDSAKLFELGETIEMACEHCHSRYWYPNEKIPTFPDPPATAPAPAPAK